MSVEKSKKEIEIQRVRLNDTINNARLGHSKIRRQMLKHLEDQKKEGWTGAYVQGYFYQGLEELGISGAKPTEFRFRQYDVDNILEDAEVLDIGSNTGFVAIYCAKLAKRVVGVELNPYLNRIARDASEYLLISNIELSQSDFKDFESKKKFDVVLSLSNHHTIDGNLNLGFEKHIERIANHLKPDGYLLFESHNVFGSGNGGQGDDGDMEEKIKIMSKYFKIERYRMIQSFLKYGDIDKLFIVARRTNIEKPIDFNLSAARQSYSWTKPFP